MRTPRRIAVVPMSWETIEEALLPPGSMIRDATFNFIQMTVDFVVEHEDLEEVPDAAVPPTLAPVVTTETAVIKRTVEW